MPQHEQRRQEQRRRIREVLSRDVRRAPCTASKTRTRRSDSPRHDAQSSHEPGAQIRNDVAVEIRHQQQVVLIGIHDELHARGVDDVLAVDDLGIFFCDIAGAAQETARRKAS